MTDRKPVVDETLRELVLHHLALTPCHITGEHDPHHTPQRVCSYQKAKLLDVLCAAAGLTAEELPRALHDDQCGWCHRVPAQEEDRERTRELHHWAGVEVPADLAELADDAPRPGDEAALEAALAELPESWSDWNAAHVWASRGLFGEVARWTSGKAYRAARARARLVERGLIEEHNGPGGYYIRRARPQAAESAR